MATENKNATTSGGVSALGLLGVLFVGLKLTGVINWSWWWVTAPFWGGLAIALAFLLVAGFVLGTYWIFASIMDYVTRSR